MKIAYNPVNKTICSPSLQHRLGCDDPRDIHLPIYRWSHHLTTDVIVEELDKKALKNLVLYLNLVEANKELSK